MRAVDTNVLVRLLARDDPRQEAAAEEFIEGGAWVSLPVLVETMWTLSSRYGQGAQAIETALKMLLVNENVSLQDSDAVAMALEWFCQRPAVGFSGCLVLALAHKAGHLPLGTFDRALGRLPGAQRL